ncbi:hypothetical protein PSYRMG_25705 (plasmid) [Pseudomonas syringae UMAF0158]|uniref:hypothetical protein n=1 Tax=Pseudomonas syringae TaxID=317 RepID=UPI0006CB5ABD|nr:hypothetical protein [Pseudomonas syringae]ALE01071.1 hypothetical protein PSYRMG_25705 [Pseudomonas syringae UMAF0158]
MTGPGWPTGDGFVVNKIEQAEEKVNTQIQYLYLNAFIMTQADEIIDFFLETQWRLLGA